jgi:hypothetical protein
MLVTHIKHKPAGDPVSEHHILKAHARSKLLWNVYVFKYVVSKGNATEVQSWPLTLVPSSRINHTYFHGPTLASMSKLLYISGQSLAGQVLCKKHPDMRIQHSDMKFSHHVVSKLQWIVYQL